MELIDTIDGMTSTDYKERFKAEYQQLKIRCEKLQSLIYKYTHNKLDFELNTPMEMIIDQWAYMTKYLRILETRAIIEGINLD